MPTFNLCWRSAFAKQGLAPQMATEPERGAATASGPIARVRAGIRVLTANKKRLFWWWVGYQAIKGILTLSLIWIPLLLIWLRSRGEA